MADWEEFVQSRLAALVGVVLVFAASATTPHAPAQAQDASRPIRMVIAFPPGGPTDFVGRLVADKAKDILGQPIIIENKPGANGAIGADMVAKSPPDGSTLFLTTMGAVAVTPHMRTDVRYDTIKDFAPITQVVLNTTLIVVRAESPFNSAKDLTAAAKAKPGELTFATTGVGSNTHLAMELYQGSAGVKFVHVPYRGAAPALTDLLGGQVQVFSADAAALMTQIKGGKIKALGAASGRRNPMLPEVATLAEQGYPDTTVDNWYGLLTPAGTPATITKIHDAFVAAINDPVVKEKLIQSGAIPVANSPAEFGTFLKQEYDRWGRIVREKGIKDDQR
jgi:tripartite-type tricarboxylate transporter receptor subunit TctC